MLLLAVDGAGGGPGHRKRAPLVAEGGDGHGLGRAADLTGMLLQAVFLALRRGDDGERAPGVALRGDRHGLLLAADLAHALLAAVLGAGGLLRHGERTPAVALRGDARVLAVDGAAVGALAVGFPAVAGAGGLLALIADPVVPLAAVAEGILRVNLFDSVLGDLLPLFVGVLLTVVLALVDLIIQLVEGFGVRFLRRSAADGAGLPVARGTQAEVVALLEQIIIVHDVYKGVRARGRDPFGNLPAVAADLAGHLNIALFSAGRLRPHRGKLADVPLIRARRQRQQRQTHQCRQHQCKGSYKFLVHGVNPRYLMLFCQLS